MLLVARDIHKKYKNLEILKGINLEVSKGEIVSIVGASGAGKSTLLHILGTLDKPDKGNVIINDEDVVKMGDSSLSKFRNQQIGFIFQFHNLLPEFTALENVKLPGLIAGRKPDEVEEKALQLLKLLGLDHRLEHKPSELSGGEQQRVSVARALINSPAVIFADEPSGNLDSKNAEELHHLFFKLRDELGQTFVIVTHNEQLANMANRKITIKDGRLDLLAKL
jgi:lipoprotein-releasing system ATP-binding protein